MNFKSEADVYAFLDRQHRPAYSSSHDVEEKANDEEDEPLVFSSSGRSTTSAAKAAKGEFGELLAKALSNQQNAAQDNSYTKLEDMFAEVPMTAMFQEKYYENPLLMDAPKNEEEKNARRQRLTTITGSLKEILARATPRRSANGASMGEHGLKTLTGSVKDLLARASPLRKSTTTPNEEIDGVVVQSTSSDLRLPRLRLTRSFRTRSSETSSKRSVRRSSSAPSKTVEDGDDSDSDSSLGDENSRQRRLSISGILQLFRAPSLPRKEQQTQDQIIRAPGPAELPDKPKKKQSRIEEILRKTSKSTESPVESNYSLPDRMLIHFRIFA